MNGLKPWIGRAGTMEDAVLKGLAKLKLTRDRVDVEVLDERISGLFSMMGFRSVKVKLTPKPLPPLRTSGQKAGRWEKTSRPAGPRLGSQTREGGRGPQREKQPFREKQDREVRSREKRPERPPQQPPRKPSPPPAPVQRVSVPVDTARKRVGPPITVEALLGQWKSITGWDDLEWMISSEGNAQIVNLKTAQASRLSGKEALEAWQYLFNLVLSRSDEERPYVRFRLEGFQDPALQRIIDVALEAAAEVKRSGRLYRLDPMSSSERRLVHQTLKDHPDVETVSEGEGPWRKVVVRPRTKTGPAAGQGPATA